MKCDFERDNNTEVTITPNIFGHGSGKLAGTARQELGIEENMARIDDYNKAVELAREALRERSPHRVAALSGAGISGSGQELILGFDFLNRKVMCRWSDLKLSWADREKEIPVQQQVLLLHYLAGAKGECVSGRWIGYQEVPDGRFYLDAFVRRAKMPLVQGLGKEPRLLAELAGRLYGAAPLEEGDCGVRVQALPRVPVALILWAGDEEFEPEGNILFDESITEILPAEDIAWLAGMVVYPLVGMVREHAAGRSAPEAGSGAPKG